MGGGLRILALLFVAEVAFAATPQEAYVADALAIIESNAVAVPNVDWPEIRARAMAQARDG